MVCDKVVCVCVTKWCVKDGVSKMVCERWCVTKWCVKNGVSKIMCEKPCERLCVTKWCERWCVKDGA